MANFDGFYEKAKSTKVYTMDRLYRPYFFVIDVFAQVGIAPIFSAANHAAYAIGWRFFSGLQVWSKNGEYSLFNNIHAWII